jgi:GNAT superfamily N-acetyltransferase
MEALQLFRADEVPWGDVQRLLAPGRCHGGACACQKFRIPSRHWAGVSDATKANMLSEQIAAGQGVVACLEGEPVGWANLAPRREFHALMTRAMLWKGRPDEPREDPHVWAVTCFFVRAGYRGRGLTPALLAKAVAVARTGGARAIEGYPQIAPPGQTVAWGEMHVGSPATFAANAFEVISQPSKRRLVMRRDL